MRYPQAFSLLRSTPNLLFLALFFCVLTIRGNPTSSPSLATPASLESRAETAHTRRRQHPPDKSTTSLSLPLSKRGQVIAHYRNLGVWRMILTATSSFFSATKNVQTPASVVANFLSTVITDASTNIARHTTETKFVEFGLGAITLAFRVRDGVGSTATVPWSIILQLAQEFEDRALAGNPTSFRAVVNGPLAANYMGATPWIEIVLVVAGKEVMDGFPWSVY